MRLVVAEGLAWIHKRMLRSQENLDQGRGGTTFGCGTLVQSNSHIVFASSGRLDARVIAYLVYCDK
jgi:hypothetical protein